MKTQRIYSLITSIVALAGALVLSTNPATAQDFNSPAVERVEDLDNGAKRVVVKQGKTWRVTIGSNQTVEKLLIDIDRPGANTNIRASGNGWTIRNIGIKGKIKQGHGLTVAGQNGTVENIYLGDGSVDMSTVVGVFVNHKNTDGPVNFHRVHISKFANNGIYGSPTVEDLNGGVVNIYDSYFNSNNITAFKLGSPLSTCTVRDTVVRTDQPAPRVSWDGQNGVVNKRGMWALDNPGGNHGNWHKVVLDNVDMQGPIVAEPGAIVELRNTRFSGNFVAGGDIHESGDPDGRLVGSSAGQPDVTPPAGVPMSPLEAATAQNQTDPAEPPETEPILELLRRSHPVVVDGALDEADWQNAPGYAFGDSSRDSDNIVEVRALWDQDSLYFGWEVEDADLETDPDVQPWKEDAVEMFLDPLLDRGADQQPDDPHIIVTLAERTSTTNHEYEDISEQLGFKSAVSRSDGGYTVEFSLDWSGLATSPEVGLELGALFANTDRDDGQAYSFTETVSSPYRRPYLWPTVVLGETSPSDPADDADAGSGMDEQDAGTGDTGHPDAGTSDDTTEPDAFGGGDTGTSGTGLNSNSDSGGCNVGQTSAPGPHAMILWLLALLGIGAIARRLVRRKETMVSEGRLFAVAFTALMTAGLGACGGGEGQGNVGADQQSEADAADSSRDRVDAGPDTDGTTPDASPAADAADGQTPSETDWAHENDHQPTLVAKRLEGSIVLDGVLDEQDYRQAMEVSFGDSAGSSENTMSVRMLWDDDYLYIGATVTDEAVEHDPSAKAFQTDSAEFLIDADRDRTSRPNPDDVHFFAMTDGSAVIKRADSFGDYQPIDAQLDSAATSREGGYVVELRLAFSDIGQQPEKHLRMGLALGNNDLDGGQVEQSSWTDSIDLLGPSTYGDLRLDGIEPSEVVPEPEVPDIPQTDVDCTFSEGPQPQTSNTINLADEGLQPGGSIDSYLSDHFKAGNKVVIPAGTYSWNGRFGGSFSSDAVLCGDGMVVLEAPDGAEHDGTIYARSGAQVRIMNLTFKGVAAAGKNRIAFEADSRSLIQVINVRHPDGSPHDGHPSPIGFYVRKDNAGKILFKDCYVANFPNNGLYISGHSGEVVVDGCVFENNLVDNLRLNGTDTAKNLLVIMNGGKYNWSGRGIRFRYPGSPHLENVHIITNVNASPIQTGSSSRMSGPVNATLKDVYIENNGSSKAIDMKVGDASATNVHITGSGNTGTSGVSGDICTGSDCTSPKTDITEIR